VQLPGPVRMRPAAPLGTNHPIMQLEGSEVRVQGSAQANELNPEPRTLNPWSALPPLDGANLIDRRDLKPNAAVLAEADDARRHPLLVAGQPGEGRVLAFAGDSTWRWQMQGLGEAHRRFWRQAVLWLAKKDEQTEGQVWIKLAGRRVMRGTRVDFTLGVENSSGEPLVAARPTVAIETPDGRAVDVRPTRSGDHWSAIFRETDKPGDYRIKVTANDGAQQLGTAEARFLVPNQDIELDRPAAEPSLMAQLAEMTASAGGKALAPEELPALLAVLAAEPPKLHEEVVAKTTYWDTWPFFLAFVTLLGTEWYLRKRWGLV
jgi:Putative glutamine amidotransferase